MIHPTESHSNLKNQLFGLIVECPTLGGNPDGCYFWEIRQRTLLERAHWVASLSHGECLAVLLSRLDQCTNKCTESMGRYQ